VTTEKAIQDHYPEETSYCFGCGCLNEAGHQLKTYWENEGTVAHFTPRPEHMAIPGYVYGGLLASLIDCHGTGTAAAASYRMAGRDPGTEPAFRFVTGSLHVDFLKPTPLGPLLTLRGEVAEMKGRKVIINIALFAAGEQTVRGQVIALQMPEQFGR
jgi:acyl-coenzyme A thioesterase PaaI-like protein